MQDRINPHHPNDDHQKVRTSAKVEQQQKYQKYFSLISTNQPVENDLLAMCKPQLEQNLAKNQK